MRAKNKAKNSKLVSKNQASSINATPSDQGRGINSASKSEVKLPLCVKDEAKMLDLGVGIGAAFLADKLKIGVIELIGDVGVGKTTLVRGIARGLKIKEAITSPSFTISKTYAFNKAGRPAQLVHYDFYRLEDPGLMSEDLEESILTPDSLTIIEWGDPVAWLLPENRMVIKIAINNEGVREVTVLADDVGALEIFQNENVPKSLSQ